MEFMMCVLIGKGEGESFELKPGKEYTVGRHSENDIKILDDNISRSHFKILIKENKYFITDLGSKNGTFVDGKDLRPGIETEVKEGVPIVIGMTILGLGPICELSLKPFLEAAGFNKVESKDRETHRSRRIMAMKKNMEFIYMMNDCIIESKDINEIFKKLINNIFNLFKRIDRCFAISINYETGQIDKILYKSKNPIGDPKKVYNKELVEQVLIMNKPVMIKNSDIGGHDNKLTESLQIMKIRSAMCVPIASCFKIRGVIYVDSLEMPNGFRESDAILLNDVGGRVALAMDNLAMQMS